ncbi:stealth family protein [Rhizohabitans arisaemae]|uniref:stealth family protein n=1 Tax=Rhizohabitans arisaemae TaxID=2720610 RepID=UPI0024B1DF65|nr:stealth family protein [Rhizohabitans arisaemae]
MAPVQARRDTLELVRTALQAARLPYFLVRNSSALTSTVAVSTRHRSAALAALAATAACRPLYISSGTDPGSPRLGAARGSWRGLAEVPILHVALYFAPPTGGWVLGPEYGCTVEFWEERGGELRAPQPNLVTEAIPVAGELVQADETLFTWLTDDEDSPAPTRTEFVVPLVDDIGFPVDAVYTWVDGDDPAWRARRDAVLAGCADLPPNEHSTTEARYTSRDELRFSLRSLAAFAPWIRHIWIVTDGQVPAWLDVDHPKISIVDHKEIFQEPDALPTFNSHAIETQLHHIDGLSEHFLYLNDDFFLGRPVSPQMFFHPNGIPQFFTSRAQVPLGPPLPEESPVHSAAKNNRRLLHQAYSRSIMNKMKHAPYALRRSLLAEIERRFAAEVRATAHRRFRSSTDVSMASSLHPYYAYLSGRAVHGSIEYTYVDLSVARTPAKLRRILACREYDAFCLNDTDATTPEQDARFRRFLERYLPEPSPFERS